MSKEKQIEDGFIEKLKDLKYIYREDIRDRLSLVSNFREKFQTLNRVNLTDSEFDRLLEDIIKPDVFASSKLLRQQNYFEREDGTPLHYFLVNNKDWCKNDFEVINQLRINTRDSHHRYDVIILINGLPLVQIELKAPPFSPRKAMQQIVDYKNDPGNGYTNTLLSFMQLFIVSNRTDTLYFSNNNNNHFAFNADEHFLPVYRLADEKNRKITNLDDFSYKFLSKCILGEMISLYMVLVQSEQKILVMRPYQIYAVKNIVDSIHENRGNGYIWHTTGSGKTLTSFKASTLLKNNPDIEKCLFVVDRKDLDRQTREEFNRFQENCVEENTNTFTLVNRLLSDDYSDKVIVTTIQKLGLALDENSKRNKTRKDEGKVTYKEKLEPLSNKRMVIIFDECHRSQFGDSHKAIKDFFPNAQLFGFTGTPIFEENASYKQIDGTVGSMKTTKDVFQNQLHSYTITNAIDDENVLRFHIDYFKPEGKAVKPGEAMAKKAVIDAILKKHHAATNFGRFNALMATSSINDAIEYYRLFKEIQYKLSATDPEYKPLNIACVFSPPADGNKDIKQIQEDLPQEQADNQQEPDKKKEALIEIIKDYNKQFGTNHKITEFDGYYQDVQQRIKDQKYSNTDYPHKNKIDITIVVDMLLTGFDSKYLNTLYVDKNLKHHGLIQAFSRTNRILNDTKPYGNILDFRSQQIETDSAIALFSGEDTKRAKEIWLVDPAPVVIQKYEKAVEELRSFMQKEGLSCTPDEVNNLKGDSARIGFTNLFKEVQKLKTQLDQYTSLSDESTEKIEALIPKDTFMEFKGTYLETAKRLKAKFAGKEAQGTPDAEQLDFEFVLFASALIDYDYIMGLISKYTDDKPSKEKMTREQLINILSSSANMMDERDDIADFINNLKPGKNKGVDEIKNDYQRFKTEKQTAELNAIAKKHDLDTETLKKFTDRILDRMIFDGEELTDLLAPLNLGWKERRLKELALMEDLAPLLNKRAAGREISGLNAYQ
jgi:type I restriction enzyme R subunit